MLILKILGATFIIGTCFVLYAISDQKEIERRNDILLDEEDEI